MRLFSYPDGDEGDRVVEALGTKARVGGSASVRAATRVKPEQASKVLQVDADPAAMRGRPMRVGEATDRGTRPDPPG